MAQAAASPGSQRCRVAQHTAYVVGTLGTGLNNVILHVHYKWGDKTVPTIVCHLKSVARYVFGFRCAAWGQLAARCVAGQVNVMHLSYCRTAPQCSGVERAYRRKDNDGGFAVRHRLAKHVISATEQPLWTEQWRMLKGVSAGNARDVHLDDFRGVYLHMLARIDYHNHYSAEEKRLQRQRLMRWAQAIADHFESQTWMSIAGQNPFLVCADLDIALQHMLADNPILVNPSPLQAPVGTTYAPRDALATPPGGVAPAAQPRPAKRVREDVDDPYRLPSDDDPESPRVTEQRRQTAVLDAVCRASEPAPPVLMDFTWEHEQPTQAKVDW